MESINLHFTGDIHALTAAHNLLSAALDNHLHQGNEEGVDVRRVDWPRALDVNEAPRDRRGTRRSRARRAAGRRVRHHRRLGADGRPRLAEDLSDLKTQIGRIVLAEDADGDPVTPDDLGVTGAAAALLRDAFRPNLVQTIEGVPALVHGGPFANIAHGTNTLVADRVGASLADYLVTEAGFGADLGAEKFAHIVAREGIVPDVAVVVATVRGAKRHGLEMWPADFDALAKTDPEAVRAGVDNVTRHVEIVESLGIPAVVGINVFPDDAESELAALESTLTDAGIPVARSTAYRDGGGGDAARGAGPRTCRHRRIRAAVRPRRTAPREGRDRRPRGVMAPTASSTSTAPTRTSTASRRGGTATSPVCVSKTPYSSRTTPR